jgi:antirestriction protein ArdC
MNLEAPNHQIMEAEQIVIGYRDKPQIISESSCSCPAYYPGTDKIKMPPMSWFDSSEAYYRALYHEMTHSTLHEHRLNRQEGKEGKFGDEKYAMEELIAELGSAFLSNIAGFPDLRNSAAYISGWASALKENQKMIILAASRAEKAAEYILGKPTFTIEEEIPEHAEPELVNA